MSVCPVLASSLTSKEHPSLLLTSRSRLHPPHPGSVAFPRMGGLAMRRDVTVASADHSVCDSFFQELGDLRASAMKNFTNIQVDESNILTWQGLILPVRRHRRRRPRTPGARNLKYARAGAKCTSASRDSSCFSLSLSPPSPLPFKSIPYVIFTFEVRQT